MHDLRHSFAVEALMRWYESGADVQANLPKLAMYMGHVSIVSTAYYLRFDAGRGRASPASASSGVSATWSKEVRT